jgi:hypothetical protein
MALPLLIMHLAAFHGLLPLVINTHRSCVLLSWRERSANEEKRMGSEQYGAEGNYRIHWIDNMECLPGSIANMLRFASAVSNASMPPESEKVVIFFPPLPKT